MKDTSGAHSSSRSRRLLRRIIVPLARTQHTNIDYTNDE